MCKCINEVKENNKKIVDLKVNITITNNDEAIKQLLVIEYLENQLSLEKEKFSNLIKVN